MISRGNKNGTVAWNEFELVIKTLDYQAECVKNRGGSRTAATSKLELFVIMVKQIVLSQRVPPWNIKIILWLQMFLGRSNQKMTLHKKWNFFIREFFSKCEQNRRKLQIRSHSLKKFLCKTLLLVRCLKMFITWI